MACRRPYVINFFIFLPVRGDNIEMLKPTCQLITKSLKIKILVVVNNTCMAMYQEQIQRCNKQINPMTRPPGKQWNLVLTENQELEVQLGSGKYSKFKRFGV